MRNCVKNGVKKLCTLLIAVIFDFGDWFVQKIYIASYRNTLIVVRVINADCGVELWSSIKQDMALCTFNESSILVL